MTTTNPKRHRPRFAVAGINHESNSFSVQPTGLADFLHPIAARDTAGFIREALLANSTVSGFVLGGVELDFEVVPGLVVEATPAGPVQKAAFEALTGQLVDSLKRMGPNLDGIYLSLHGAMVVDGYASGDLEIVRRVRAAFGTAMPLVVTHDFHANVSEEIVAATDALITYKENPHIDTKERGRQAATILHGMASGTMKPVQAIYKPSMVYNIGYQHTKAVPLLPIVDETRRLEGIPGILAASVAGGYQYSDVPHMGPSVVIVTNGDRALAEREARRVGGLLWDTREETLKPFPDAAAAVAQAMASEKTPVVLMDMGDNVGGGSAADSTVLLRQLMECQATGWIVVLSDPAAVKAAFAVGADAEISVDVGGKTDTMHGQPVRLVGRVRSLHDGKYVEPLVRHVGARYYDMGHTAVLEAQGSTPDAPNFVVVTTRRDPPYSLEQTVSLGLHPERQKILVVKGVVAPRAAYLPIAGLLIAVDTPGATTVNPKRLPYKHVRRPLFGLD